MLTFFRAALIGFVGVSGRFGGKWLGLLIGKIANAIGSLVPPLAERLARLAEHGILLFATSDAGSTAKALAVQIGRSSRPPLYLRGHALLIRMREVDEARAISRRHVDQLGTPEKRLLTSAEARSDGDHVAALDSLGPPSEDDAAGRAARLDLLRQFGRMSAVLDQVNTELVGADVATRYVFDSLWDLGRSDDAVASITPEMTRALRSVDTVRRIRDGYRDRHGSDETVLKQLLPDPTDSPDWYATLLLEFDRVEELVDLASTPAFVDSLGPSGRLCVARARYISRDFDGAVRLLKPLRATSRRWDAEKLLARIELELGISARTVNRRIRSRRPGEGFDEVAYLGLHQIGRHAEAFTLFLPDVDRRRLIEVFGDRADFTGTEHVARRLVLPQGGPGDEILMAAAYTQLALRAGRTEAACDPRLYHLLSRSFPNLTFHPCTRRMGQPSPGFCAPNQPERADHVLYEHFDRRLEKVAQNTDRVMFSRSLGGLLLDQFPFEAYLVPNQQRIQEQRDRVAGGVGVVWRSEFFDAARRIHYLTPDDLAPLVELGRPIICLQHDARSNERETLRRVFGEMLVMLDDLDMRDDFETMAAVVASLDLVVGIGTTIVELAGSLGTPTVAMYPNRIGSWRRRGATNDHWHRSMQTAIAVDVLRPEGVVEEALRIIRSND